MIGIARNASRHVPAALLALALCGTVSAGSARVLGVELAVDESGRLLRPTPEIVQQLRVALADTYAATHEANRAASILPGSARSLVLDERHAAFSIASVDDTGRISTRCVAGAASAEALLSGVAAAAPREEE